MQKAKSKETKENTFLEKIHFLNKHSLQFLPVNEQKIDNFNHKWYKFFFIGEELCLGDIIINRTYLEM